MSERKICQVAGGGAKPAMSRLKELALEAQEQVIGLCEARTYKEASPLVGELVGFACSQNVLCRFRKWHKAQEELVLGKDRLLQMTEFLQSQMPGVSPDKVKELGSMFFSLMAMARDDAKAFVNVNRMEIQNKREQLRQKKLELEERKFKQSLRTKLDTGLDALGTHFKKNPEAMKHFQKAREALGSKELEEDESLKSEVQSRPVGMQTRPKSGENDEGRMTNGTDHEVCESAFKRTEGTETTNGTDDLAGAAGFGTERGGRVSGDGLPPHASWPAKGASDACL